MQPFLALMIAASATVPVTRVETVYNVVEVRQEKSFAGRLGERVKETLVIAVGSQTYMVRVDGNFHTNIDRGTTLVKKGDKVTFVGRSNPKDGSVRREDIRKVR